MSKKKVMSRYPLEGTSTIIRNGVEYTGHIDKEVGIDFSAVGYAVKVCEDAENMVLR